LPDAEAIVQGEIELTWRAFDAAADALAADLLAAGLGHQAKVAVYMANRAEYLVAYFAAFKAGLAPFNINYRYGAEEVAYSARQRRRRGGDLRGRVCAGAGRRAERFAGVKRWIAAAQPGVASPPGPRRMTTSSHNRGGDAGDGAVGPIWRGPVPALHRRHDRHAQGRDVAAGRPDGAGRPWRQSGAGLGPWSEPAEAGSRAAAQASRVRSLIPVP
jgi:hypothetical protein